MAYVTTDVAVTNAAKVELAPSSTSRRSYVVYNPGPVSVDLFFNTQLVRFVNLLAGGHVVASVAEGDTMDQIKAQLNGGAGPQNITISVA